MLKIIATICLALALRVSSQNNSATNDTTCVNSFLGADATGNSFFSFFDTSENGTNVNSGTFQWVYTVENQGSNSFWLGSPPGVDLFSATNDFSACVIGLSLPLNTIERGQSDPGNCQETLDLSCANALVAAASETADNIIAGLISQPILSLVCSQIAEGIVAQTRNASCAPFFPSEGGGGTVSFALSTGTPPSCQASSPAYPNLTFTSFQYHVNDDSAAFPLTDPYQTYDIAYRAVNAIFTVFMPPANINATAKIGGSEAFLNCVRITNTSSDARIAPALPNPTAVAIPGKLRVGAIAGIVIGCVAGCAIIAGCIYLFLRRRRQNRLATASSNPLSSRGEKGEDGILLGAVEAADFGSDGAELRGDQPVNEVSGKRARQEMGSAYRPPELDSDYHPVELDGATSRK